jgi:diketogulonate reductase-like aldo/keto reductase
VKETVKNPIVFDLQNKRIQLNSGYYMPTSGLGTYSLTGSTCYNSILTALQKGVRLIDSAYMYSNEEQVGNAVRDSGIDRSEIFVTTKIYPSQFSNPENAIELALSKLNIEYIDLMLLHHPGDKDVEAYLTMEKYVKSGKIKSIGLSNWYIKELKSFLPKVNIMPAIVQNEIHPYYQETNVINYIYNDIRDKGIIVEGWYPLGGRGYNTELLKEQVLSNIGKKYNKTNEY